MPTNVVLVRWQGGWHERTLQGYALDELPPRRIEGTLGLGAAQSVQEVDRIADAQLAIFGEPQVQISAEIAPNTVPLDALRTPYLGFTVGDTVEIELPDGTSRERLMAVTVTEDEQGVVGYSTDWRSIITQGEEAFAQWLKKMSNGTMGGQSKPATPVAQVGAPDTTCCPPQPAAPIPA